MHRRGDHSNYLLGHCNPIRSTLTEATEASHHRSRQTILSVVVFNLANNRHRLTLNRPTPTPPRALRHRRSRRAWRPFNRLNPAYLMDIQRMAVMATGTRRRTCSHRAVPVRGLRHMCSRGAAVRAAILSLPIRTQHQLCGNVRKLARRTLVGGIVYKALLLLSDHSYPLVCIVAFLFHICT